MKTNKEVVNDIRDMLKKYNASEVDILKVTMDLREYLEYLSCKIEMLSEK